MASEWQHKVAVSSLFAEGVDVGVELALRWIEAELARYGTASGSVQPVLRQIRALSHQARRRSLRQQVLRESHVPQKPAHSAAASP